MNLLHKCILLISMVFVFLFSMMTVNVSAGQPAEKKLRYRNILLRDFRTVKDGQVINFNIGTAAHAPATLAVLKKYLPPEVKITVWADAPLAPELAEMMARRFPEVLIVHGDLNNAPPEELLKAVDEADLFLVSSGSTITFFFFFRHTSRITTPAITIRAAPPYIRSSA